MPCLPDFGTVPSPITKHVLVCLQLAAWSRIFVHFWHASQYQDGFLDYLYLVTRQIYRVVCNLSYSRNHLIGVGFLRTMAAQSESHKITTGHIRHYVYSKWAPPTPTTSQTYQILYETLPQTCAATSRIHRQDESLRFSQVASVQACTAGISPNTISSCQTRSNSNFYSKHISKYLELN
jgi:hypothetical protein